MAVLWSKSTDGWGARRLDGAQFDLAADSVRRAEETAHAAPSPKMARLLRAEAGGSPAWALIAPAHSAVRVNGSAVAGGLRVLADRDEIRLGGEARYFSTETLAEVLPFPGAARAVYCGRCRQKIEAGTPAVCCPNCGIWYCQTAELNCWTYAETCAFCPQPTDLDAGFAWSPEEG